MAASIQQTIRQSPPVDLSRPYDARWLHDRHILITGGASGFGAGFVRRWAASGASVVLGDVDADKGEQLASSLRQELGNANIHFVHCDVTDWQSQVNLFKQAVKLSPHGGIDTVVANAGIAGADQLVTPGDMSADEPPEPNLKVTDVNFYGVLYTTHLAFYYLPRNPGSSPSDPNTDPSNTTRDRHLLLLGSMASLAPIAILPQYGAAKHAVLGLFRSLRTSSFVQGVRVNMILPYFVDTPMLSGVAKTILAGNGLGKADDVVDAGTRFTADSSICGRALVVGPPVKAMRTEDGQLRPVVGDDTADGTETGIWECYADDFEETEVWTRRWVAVLNQLERAIGWSGWAKDMAKTVLSAWRGR
ncbi:uncharacterized protein K452DRAFT_328721 [Aplosporella prunicola CBS 121167]|uniref:NAD(P)-binding protein n=1 Tax=Aplosporella prunicola CBS 121167 TaxID=1176127 RepID=A0A6A6B6V4_9PEZI|nr:uncharacterized protein K452DRAFT_328721 [Aplosporella prunicola CBS 121167]KAF2138531.1 hypothetical protein K452DRAFT_328721 [Aplosporella prunicola CBS 121167]